MLIPDTKLPSFASYLPDTAPAQGQALCIGVFDGVHRGHQALLRRAAEVAQTSDLQSAALTFDPHPASVFAPSRMPPLLGTLAERVDLLQEKGAENVIVAPFDRTFAALTPEEFVRDLLVGRLHVKAVVIGEDFRFGCDRSGNAEFLEDAGHRYGFTVHAVAPVFVNGVPARSTTIRQMLTGGEVAEAAQLLGRDYRLTGTVVHGKKLGRTIGYPTANLETEAKVLVPAAGVYAGRARLADGSVWRTAISIGTNPTVTPDSRTRTVEAFLMDDFRGDLYHQVLRLEFVAYLRPTLKFDGLPALIEQMERDVAQAARVLTSD